MNIPPNPPANATPESHRDYADIQIMIAGGEKIRLHPSQGAGSPPYLTVKKRMSCSNSQPEEDSGYIPLTPGQFIIFFPTDIHQPELYIGQPSLVKKTGDESECNLAPDMDHTQKLDHKAALKQYARDQITRRIDTARQSADQAQHAANQEEKSSAGDKYETGRAMNHLEQEMHARQLAEHTRELAILHQVNAETLYTTPTAGRLYSMPGPGHLHRSRSGAKQQLNGKTILFLSPTAPLATTLRGKKIGDTLSFGGNQLSIEDIY